MKFPIAFLLPIVVIAQPAPPPDRGGPNGPGGFGPGGPGRGGPGGFGGMGQETKLVAQFDTDGDKRLNATERAAAREHHLATKAARGGGRGPGGFGGRGGEREPGSPGVKLTPAEVKSFDATVPLYDRATLRTLFLEFADDGWEKEMEDFYRTDVEVPATLTVDGKTYRDIGAGFRGASSFMMIQRGSKRSLNLTLDHTQKDQNLLGSRTLNLLNSNDDPSFSRAALYSLVAQDYLPTPQVNFMRVVINGENWGIYASAEQFNKDFLQSRFGSDKGARWKVPGSPGGRGGLAYLGDDIAAYKRTYEIKSKDDDASWWKLIRLAKALEQTEPEKLEAALAPLLDVDGALRFLALDTTFANGDGFWTRTSDYSIGEDKQGRLHLIPHDMNETFSFGGGPGGRGGRGPGGPGPDGRGGPPPGFDPSRGGPPPGFGGPGGRGPGGFGGGGVQLDPLAVAKNPNAVIAQKLLAVPALRARYLGYVRDMAETWLDWRKIGPVARAFHELIDADVKRDTRKLASYAAFQASVEEGPRSLKAFCDQRRAFLLGHDEIKNLPR